MEFKNFSQKEILKSSCLTSFILDTTADNLSYIYGEEMRSEESRQTWIKYNLEKTDKTWHAVTGFRNGEPLGFIIYKISKSQLYICDIEIKKCARRNPVLLGGLFKKMITDEAEGFNCMAGYINKENRISQNNFLKYATEISESDKGYSFTINEQKTSEIKQRFLK